MKKFYSILLAISLMLTIISGCNTNKEFTPKEPKELILPNDNSHLEYDVIVVGGDPEGIAAAISSARNGLKTLLVDKRDRIGGLMTVGWLNSIDMNYDPDGKILNKGIFTEFYNMIEGDSFNIQTAQKALNTLVGNEGNLEVLLNVNSVEPIIHNDEIKDIKISLSDKEVDISAKIYIDATQDADFAVLAKVPFTVGQEDYLGTYRSMASTLVFELDHVNWSTIRKELQNDEYTHTGANDVSAWGFYQQMKEYKPKDPDVGMRGLNIGRVDENRVLINALYVFGVNGLEEQSKKDGINKAKKELEYIVPFMNENVPGFENATLVAVAPELYIRETRHMKGLYRLTIDDVLENRDFEDRIAFGSYPVDIQSFSPTELGYIVGKPKQYAIPFRSIVPPNVSNLLVVGRSASFDSLAHGSARVIPVGMATGEAAGVASAYAIAHRESFQTIANNIEAIHSIQEQLNKQGMKIEPFSYDAPIIDHWAYEGVKFIRDLGMISAGYNNDYHLEDAMNLNQLKLILYNANKRLGLPFGNYHYEPVKEPPLLDKDLFANEILKYLGQRNNRHKGFDNLAQLNLLSSSLLLQIDQSESINRAIIYTTIHELYEKNK